MVNSSRRLILRVGVKLMLLFSAIIVLFVLLSSIRNHDNENVGVTIPPIRLQLSDTLETNPRRIPWAGGNLIMVWRDASLLSSLTQHDSLLVEPHFPSVHQSTEHIEPVRATHPEIFVAFDRGTDMGCPLNWIPAGNHDAPLQPWPGGFRDNCRGSWYDAAGRVFKGQEAQRNLDIPPYRLLEGGLLEIGVSGDNAALAN